MPETRDHTSHERLPASPHRIDELVTAKDDIPAPRLGDEKGSGHEYGGNRSLTLVHHLEAQEDLVDLAAEELECLPP